MESAAASVRQNAATTRWNAASPASPEQITEIIGCRQDLAKHMARLDLRLDPKTRRGKQAILFPLYSRQAGGRLEVSAIQFLTDNSDSMDFMGATETRIFRNQEAAVTVLPMIPLPKDVDTKTAKRPNNLMLVMGGKDALVLNLVTGIETIALPSPRIPHHLAEKWAKGETQQIWIHGAVEWEMREMMTRLQDAGFAGYIRWTGNPIARIKPGMEPEASGDGEDSDKPVLNEMNAEIPRDDAWVTYLTHGPDAVKSLLAGSVTVHNPKKIKAPSESGSPVKNAEKALNTHRQTGKKRDDQAIYYPSPDEASEFLNQVLHEGGEHVVGLVATTGTGKTRAIVARMLLDTDHAYIYGAPTNDLAQETFQAAIEMQEQLLKAGKLKHMRSLRFHEPRSEENCERWQVVTFLQTENRAPWAQGCQIKDLSDGVKGDCPHADQCKNHGYLAGLDASKKSEVVFTVHQALTGDSSLLGYASGLEERGELEERLIIVDEYIPMFSKLEMRVDDVLKNILAADKRIDQKWIERYAERVLDPQAYSPDVRRKMAREAFIWYNQHYRPIMQGIMAQVADHADPKKDPQPHDVKISGAWADFMQTYPNRPQWLDQMDGSTLGERPYLVGSQDQWILPRLWLDALYEALKNDLGVFFYDGKLIVGRESGLFKTLLKQGGYLLDATMPQGHQEVIRQFQGGKNGEKKGAVIDVPVSQPFLKILQVLDGNKHVRAALGRKAISREIGKFMNSWQEMIALHGSGKVAILAHRPIRYILAAAFSGDCLAEAFEHLGKEKAAAMEEKILHWLDNKGWTYGSQEWRDLLKSMGIPADPGDAREKHGITLDDVAMLGHWGNDDRGHNRWENASALMIWGAPLKTPQEYQIEYHIHRAIMKKHGIELEYWDGSVEKGQTIVTNGGEDELDCSFPLPTVADARRYVLSSVNAQIAQGIGRLRGVRRTAENPAEVILYLGDFPVSAVEGGDYHLPTIAYQTSLQSYLCQKATKESVAVSVVAAMEGGRICLQEICDAVNHVIGNMKLSIPKMGRDGARNLLNKIRSYSVSLKISLTEAARMLADKIMVWIMAPSGIVAPESFYAAPEAYARQISDHTDWIEAVAILAKMLEPLDPGAKDARAGYGRWCWPDGTVTTF